MSGDVAVPQELLFFSLCGTDCWRPAMSSIICQKYQLFLCYATRYNFDVIILKPKLIWYPVYLIVCRNTGLLHSSIVRELSSANVFLVVHQLLENRSCMTPTPQMMVDLQSLSRALLDTLNDKSMALSHQRKTNKSV